MRFSTKTVARIGALGIAIAGAVVALPATAAHADTPSITVTPNTGVTDGGSVSVTGSGFPTTDTTVYLVECSGTTGQAACDTGTLATATLTAGAFTATNVTVHEGTVGNGSCAAGATCFIAASSVITGSDATNSTAAPFTFSATVLPSITVTPNTGVANNGTVSVTGSGFPTTDTTAYIVECSGTTGQAACDLSTLATATLTAGAFTATNVTVHEGTVGNGTCAVGGTCYIAASSVTSGSDATNSTAAPFTFAGATGPTATATPDTNVKDGQTLKVSGSGFPKKVNPLYILECSTQTGGTQGSDCNLTTGILGTKSTTANGTFSNIPLKVTEGKFGSASCKAGGTCYIAVSTSTSPTPAEATAITFTFAKGGSTAPAKTKTAAKFSKKKDAITGKVTSAGKGIKGLKEKLEVKAGKKWKKADSAKTGKGGKFTFKKVASGKYKVETAGNKSFKGSESKVVKAKA